jgi:hypothetical protein
VEAEGVAWWSAADRPLLRITFEITDGETGVRVRRLKDQVTATILRPLASFGLLTSPKSMAHDDVSALLAAVARQMGLGEPPNLPGRRG